MVLLSNVLILWVHYEASKDTFTIRSLLNLWNIWSFVPALICTHTIYSLGKYLLYLCRRLTDTNTSCNTKMPTKNRNNNITISSSKFLIYLHLGCFSNVHTIGQNQVVISKVQCFTVCLNIFSSTKATIKTLWLLGNKIQGSKKNLKK